MKNLSLLEVNKEGQTKILKQIFKKLKLSKNSKLLLLEEDDSILLKKVDEPIVEFESLSKETQQFAKEKKLNPKDFTKIIKKVRVKN